jgi:putative transposon-encoded protein
MSPQKYAGKKVEVLEFKDPRFQFAWYNAILLENQKAKKRGHVVIHWSDYDGTEEVPKKYLRTPSENPVVYKNYHKHFGASDRVEVGCYMEDEISRTWFVATVMEVSFHNIIIADFDRALNIVSSTKLHKFIDLMFF